MIRQHSQPSPLGYYNLGTSYLKAAKALALQVRSEDSAIRLSLRFEHPIYHLYGQSLELFLKSFLLEDGIPEETLRRKFGHNLVNCYHAISGKWKQRFDSDGLVKITSEHLGWLHKEKFYHYLFTGSFSQIELSFLDGIMMRFMLSNRDVLTLFGYDCENRISPGAVKLLGIASEDNG